MQIIKKFDTWNLNNLIKDYDKEISLYKSRLESLERDRLAHVNFLDALNVIEKENADNIEKNFNIAILLGEGVECLTT